MIHSNIPKRPTVLAAVGLAVTVALLLSVAQPASAHCKKRHADAGPPHCPVDPPPDDGEPIIEACEVGRLCIADVPRCNWTTNRPVHKLFLPAC